MAKLNIVESNKKSVFIRLIVGATVLASSALASFFLYGHFIVISKFLNERNYVTQTGQKYLPEFMDDLKEIESSHIFKKVTLTANAEPFISKYVFTDESDKDSVGSENQYNAATRILSRFSGWDTDESLFLKLKNDPQFKSIDVKWVSNLLIFDHIDLSSNSRLNEKLKNLSTKIMAKNDFREFFKLEILKLSSYYTHLINSVLIYTIKKSIEFPNEKEKTLVHLQHLSQLLLTSESANITVYKTLKYEFILAKYLNIQTRSNLTIKLLNKVKRTAFAWPSFIDSLVNTKNIDVIEPFLNSESFICGLLSDFSSIYQYEEFFVKSWPGEINLKSEVYLYDKVYRLLFEKCGKKYGQIFYNSNKFKVMSKIPYWTQIELFSTKKVFNSNTLKFYIVSE